MHSTGWARFSYKYQIVNILYAVGQEANTEGVFAGHLGGRHTGPRCICWGHSQEEEQPAGEGSLGQVSRMGQRGLRPRRQFLGPLTPRPSPLGSQVPPLGSGQRRCYRVFTPSRDPGRCWEQSRDRVEGTRRPGLRVLSGASRPYKARNGHSMACGPCVLT